MKLDHTYIHGPEDDDEDEDGEGDGDETDAE